VAGQVSGVLALDWILSSCSQAWVFMKHLVHWDTRGLGSRSRRSRRGGVHHAWGDKPVVQAQPEIQ
jgi:hypothetical protein